MTRSLPENSTVEPVVRVRNLVRAFYSVPAVDGVSFDIVQGEMFGLIGPDGAGKTTTLRMILGLVTPDSGEIETCGFHPKRQHDLLSEKVGYLSQRFSLYGDLSVDENIAFFAAVHGIDNWRPRRDELLAMLRLDGFRDRLADRLSGGMKQKLALTCTLIHKPEFLVLDESTTGVDPVSRREFWKILSELQQQGMTILLTTPYLDEAERCARVALLMNGRILNLDTPQALRKSGTGSVIEVLASPKRQAAELLGLLPDITELESFGERLHATVPSLTGPSATAFAEDIRTRLQTAGLRVTGVRATTPSLEDVFISRIRHAQPTKGTTT